MAQRDGQSSWRSLRALRSRPPVQPGDERIFTSALQQAEDLFASAAASGYATRALPLFYGLSQAGRAVAVVGEPGLRLKAHGIKAGFTASRGLAAGLGVTVRATPDVRNGSFTELTRLLDSAQMSTPQPLAQLAEQLLEVDLKSPTERVRRTLLPSDHRNGDGATWAINVPFEGEAFEDEDFDALKHTYPDLEGFEVHRVHYPGRAIQPGRVQLNVRESDENGSNLLGRPYRNSRVLLPAIQGENRTLDALMLWWSVLFGLSMLTRYEPDQWVGAINVDESPTSVQIELILDEALNAVPDIVERTIQRLEDQER